MSRSAVELAVQNAKHNQRILCPACAPTRKKSKQKTLSITVEPDGTKLFCCHHCDISGRISEKRRPSLDLLDEFLQSVPGHPNVIELPSATHDRELDQFMESRGISRETYQNFGVTSDIRWFDKKAGEQLAVGFTYGDPAEPSAIKWRSLKSKAFTQTGAAQTFYGLEQLPKDLGEQPLIICEGELDTLSFAEAGMPSISVPNGAPAKPVRSHLDDGVKWNYLWESRELLDCTKIILAVDHDQPGDNLKQEIARRVGRGRCWEVEFSTELKDANAVLCAEGPERLREIIEAATPMPLAGVFSAKDYQEQVEEIFDAGGTGKGLSTGFKSLDKILTIAPGLYVITGMAGHGKSSLIDNLLLNTSEQHGYRWAVCSMENPVPIHILKLAALKTQKPFFEGPTERMSKQELRESIDWINDRFCFLENKDGEVATIDSIIRRSRDALLRLGINGLLIDPYNFLEPTNKNTNEHQEISANLSKIISFSQEANLTVFFVAHPTKQYPQGEKEKPVDGNAISGSYSWASKTDFGVTLFRTNDPNDHTPEVIVWKSRFNWIAQRGSQKLSYDVATGKMSDIKDNFDWSVD